MNLRTAVRIVAADQIEGDAATVDEAILHVWNTLLLPGTHPIPGGWHIEDDGTETAQAYIAVVAVRETVSLEDLLDLAGEDFQAAYEEFAALPGTGPLGINAWLAEHP